MGRDGRGGRKRRRERVNGVAHHYLTLKKDPDIFPCTLLSSHRMKDWPTDLGEFFQLSFLQLGDCVLILLEPGVVLRLTNLINYTVLCKYQHTLPVSELLNLTLIYTGGHRNIKLFLQLLTSYFIVM